MVPAADLLAALATSLHARMVFLDLDGWPTRDPTELDALFATVPQSCIVVVRATHSQSAASDMRHASSVAADFRDSWRAWDDLACRLDDPRGGPPATASIPFARSLARDIAQPDAPAVDRVSAIASCCMRCVDESFVAAAVGCSGSTLRRRLASWRLVSPALPAFPELNSWFVALHVAWARERFGVSAKEAAMNAGFSCAKACDAYLTYNIGLSTARILDSLGYRGVLGRITAWFRPLLTSGSISRSAVS